MTYFYSLFFYLSLIFYYIIEWANGHTLHYDYTLYDCMWQNLNLNMLAQMYISKTAD